MEGQTITLWGVLGAVGLGILIAVIIVLAINRWKSRP